MPPREELTESERELLREFVDHTEQFSALEKLLRIEAEGWKVRVLSASMNVTSTDATTKLVEIAAMAGRASQCEHIPGLLRRKVYPGETAT